MKLFRSNTTNPFVQRLAICAVAFAMIVVVCGRLQSQERRSRPVRLTHSTSVLENTPAGETFDHLRNAFPDLDQFELIAENREIPIRVTRDGELQISDQGLLNHEMRNLWLLTVRARMPRNDDPYLQDFIRPLEGLGDSTIRENLAALRATDVVLSIRVHVIDQDETPVLADTLLTLEQAQAPQVLGRVAPIEFDRNDDLHYEITCSTSPECLDIDSKSGVVSLKNADHFDWTNPRQAMEVEVRDRRGNSARTIVELSVVAAPQTINDEHTNIATKTPSMTQDVVGDGSEQVPFPDDASTDGLPDKVSVPVEMQLSEVRYDYHHMSSQSRSAFGDPGQVTTDSIDANAPGPASAEVSHATTPTPAETEVPVVIYDSENDAQTLNDAARNIQSGATSNVTLNAPVEPTHEPADAPNKSSMAETANDDGTVAEYRRSVRRSPFQLLLFFSALAMIGFVVFIHYRRARQARLEAMKPTVAEADARLDLYMTAHAKAHNDSEVKEEDIPEIKPAKVTVEKEITDDPDAAFDPESLIDEAMLEVPAVADAICEVKRDLSKPESLLSDSSSALSTEAATSTHRESSRPSGSSLLILSEDLLADEILNPSTNSHNESLSAALEQLQAINEKLEERTHQPAAERGMDSDWNIQDTREWLPSAGPSTAETTSQTEIVGDAIPVAVAEDTYEPSYELIWDPEIQRYIKVERPAPIETAEDQSTSHELADSECETDNSKTQEFVLPESSVSLDDHPSTLYTPEEPPSERVQSLRAELADLFNLHAATTAPVQQPVTESPEVSDDSTSEDSEKSTEENHLDSVAKYLSQLLERSKKEEASDIFIDRRKSSSAVWDGQDRRNRPKPATKSYIESYLEQHGGQLESDMAALKTSAERPPEMDQPAAPPRERKPVDITTLRKNMESFRAVAERSVETAIATYQVRTAKGRLVGRSMLIAGLVVIVALGIGTNVFRRFHLQPLNWLMCAFILLCVAEFFLRVESIRQHRREMRLRIINAQKPAPHPIPEPSPPEPTPNV